MNKVYKNKLSKRPMNVLELTEKFYSKNKNKENQKYDVKRISGNLCNCYSHL